MRTLKFNARMWQESSQHFRHHNANNECPYQDVNPVQNTLLLWLNHKIHSLPFSCKAPWTLFAIEDDSNVGLAHRENLQNSAEGSSLTIPFPHELSVLFVS